MSVSSPINEQVYREVSDFLCLEAELLDEGRLREWLRAYFKNHVAALYSRSGPIAGNGTLDALQPDGHNAPSSGGLG
jgi:hypothetical protein